MLDTLRRNRYSTLLALGLIATLLAYWIYAYDLALNLASVDRLLRRWPWLILALVFFALLAFIVFGWNSVKPNTMAVVRGPDDQIQVFKRKKVRPLGYRHILPPSTFERNGYMLPFGHKLVAVLPDYQLNFEFDISDIETQTPRIARIGKIRVRTAYEITHPEAFYRKSSSFYGLIKNIEEATQRPHTDEHLWVEILQAIVKSVVDDTLRDIVWRWQNLRAADPDLMTKLTFESLKNSDDDPYGLSLNRLNLARHAASEITSKLMSEKLGITLRPLVFESIVIDDDMINKKTRSKDRELAEAEHEAQKVITKGKAEAEIRSITLAKLLNVLINDYKIPYTDPLVAQVVRAALYSDGELIWNGVIDKGKSTNGATPAKTA